MDSAEKTILDHCRNSTLRTRGTWGLRTDVAVNGYGEPGPRVPCAVIDLARTRPHPKRFGFTAPIILASGDTWDEVLAELLEKGEV